MTPTTEYAIAFSAGASATVFIFERVLRLVRESGRSKNGNGAGEKSVEFWRATHAEIVRNELHPYLERNQEALQAIRDNTTRLAIVAERFWK